MNLDDALAIGPSWYRQIMASLPRLRSAVLVSILTAGCGGGGGGGPVRLSEFKAREIDAYCRHAVKCGALPDFATCKTLPPYNSATDQLLASVNAGRIQYDENAATVWIAAIGDRGCDYADMFSRRTLLAWASTFKGLVGGSGTCFIDQDCASARCNRSSCSITDACCLGTCTAGPPLSNPVAAGGDCSVANAVCVDGTDCNYSDTVGTPSQICTPGLALGQPCDPYSTARPCLLGTICRAGSGGYACMAPPAEGEDCFGSGFVCSSHLDACSPNSAKCLRKVALGQPCTTDSTCVDYALCVSGTCVEKRKPGESCDPSLGDACMGWMSCNGGTCVARYVAPDPCTGTCGVAGAGGATGTGGRTSVTCNPGCAPDQDCINGSCLPSAWYGTTCATDQDCPASTTCCGGSNESCDGTRLPAGDNANSGELVVSADGLTVTDTITGLVWQRDGGGARPGCSGSDELTCTRAEAQAYCAGLTLGGLSGWRLPAAMELTTILDLTRTSPAIDPTAFLNSSVDGGPSWTGGGEFWTSSPAASPTFSPDASPPASLLSLRSVSFDGGSLGSSGVSNPNLVRCVRGSRCYPMSRFAVLDGGLVRDTLTNLTWQQQASATIMSWSDAQIYCLCAGAGFRLPTVKELASIVDVTVTSGAIINQTAFPNTPPVAFWTSSPYVGSPSPYTGSAAMWEVDFSSGYSYHDDARAAARARCVR